MNLTRRSTPSKSDPLMDRPKNAVLAQMTGWRAALMCGALVVCAAHLAACACSACEDEETADVREANAAAEQAFTACPTLARVQDEFGATLGGRYGGAALIEYRIRGTREAPQIDAPLGADACSAEIAGRLTQACDLCERQPDACLGLVQSFMNTPSGACTICGDTICTSPAESNATCAEDCRCGDGTCESAETAETCPEDCAGTCGDDFCAEPIEACECDPGDADCIPCIDCCRAVCGDGDCDAHLGEADPDNARYYCEVDCGKGSCGDGVCHPSEGGAANCPIDCAGLDCGDGICAAPETCFNCPEDCSGPNTVSADVCLDGVCGVCEPITCTADCLTQDYACGDGECSGIENPANCPTDCPWDRDACGDGTCDPRQAETPANCPEDCVTPRQVCGDGFCDFNDNACDECLGCNSSNRSYLCVGDERLCGAPSPGDSREAVLDCSTVDASCAIPNIEVCEGRCAYDVQGQPGCVDCPAVAVGGILPTLCPPNFEPFCVSATSVRTCGIDPAYSDAPQCSVVRTELCDGRCVAGACTNQPVVAIYRPVRGIVGTTVAIGGTAFGDAPGTVEFSDGAGGFVAASVTRWLSTEITAVVPEGFGLGPIRVTTSGGEATVTEGDFRPITEPTVTALRPSRAAPGALVRIEGVGFGAQAGEVVFTQAQSASIVAWSDQEIQVLVPPNASNGFVTVATTTDTLQGPAFVVETPAQALINDIQPRDIRPGDVITVTGSGFGPGGTVTFPPTNDPAVIQAWSEEQITVVVPDRVTDGPIRLSTTLTQLVSSIRLNALPSVLNLAFCGEAPNPRAGDTITVEGNAFGNTRGTITFTPDLVAPRASWTDTVIRVGIPANAQPGPVLITTDDGDTVTFDLTLRDPIDPIWRRARWPMPDSPTAACGTPDGPIPCPAPGEPYYGQDGNRVSATSLFVLSDDTTYVHDTLTGLMWQRYIIDSPDVEPNCFCEDLTLGGFDDWRLPSMVELVTLFDYSANAPATDLLPNTSAVSFEAAASTGTNTWLVDLSGYQDVDRGTGRVRCVRAVDPNPTVAPYTVEDNTVADPNTGLMWQRQHHTPPQSWADALGYCEDLSLDGHDDWRLPSIKELTTIIDRTRWGPPFNTDLFPNLPTTAQDRFWSSTFTAALAVNPQSGPRVYSVGMSLGTVYPLSGFGASDHLTRCVRDLP